MDDIWPCSIIAARYSGAYEGGEWLAFARYPWDIPEEVHGDDLVCVEFFHTTAEPIGRGSTPDQAFQNLRERMGADVR